MNQKRNDLFLVRKTALVLLLPFIVLFSVVDIQWKTVHGQSSISTAIPTTAASQSGQNTSTTQVHSTSGTDTLVESLGASLIGIVSAIVIGIISAGATYFFGIRQLRYQLEAELRNEYEITRQRLKADLEREYQSRFNEKKWELYVRFAGIVRRQIETSKLSKERQNKELQNTIKSLYDFLGELWIVGNDEVVEAFNTWRKTSLLDGDNKVQEEPFKALEDLMQIVIAMRRDLGYESSRLRPEDLLRTFINDFYSQAK